MTSNTLKIAFVGFGEAAQAFAKGLTQDGSAASLCAFDIKTDGAEAAGKHADYVRTGVAGHDTCAAACQDAEAIFSMVTAEQAENAARSAAQSDLTDCFYFDCNSCAPNTKRRSAAIIQAAGGRYVDVAIMTPVLPKLHKSPCLIAGPHAQSACDMLRDIDMEIDIAGDDIGDASARKMVRSVMIKGLEALTLECFLAARRAGVEADILASLEGSFPGFDWQRRAPYMIERAITHGTRRAAEMKEVAKTLHDLGVASHMTDATVARQSEVGALALEVSDSDAQDLATLTDALLAKLTP